MPFRLDPPIEKEFILERTDKVYGTSADEPTRITVKQATQGENERRSSLFSRIKREVSDDTVVNIVTDFSPEVLKRFEVFLTLKACNILDEDGKPLFRFRADGAISEADFVKAWSKLPPLVADEIHEKVLELNPTWDFTSGE